MGLPLSWVIQSRSTPLLVPAIIPVAGIVWISVGLAMGAYFFIGGCLSKYSQLLAEEPEPEAEPA